MQNEDKGKRGKESMKRQSGASVFSPPRMSINLENWGTKVEGFLGI